MTLLVDFNERDQWGRVPAYLRGSQPWSLEPGDLVLAVDDEDNRCKAQVEEVSISESVAYLALVPNTSEPSNKSDWIVESQRAADEVAEGGSESEYERFRDLARELLQSPRRK